MVVFVICSWDFITKGLVERNWTRIIERAVYSLIMFNFLSLFCGDSLYTFSLLCPCLCLSESLSGSESICLSAFLATNSKDMLVSFASEISTEIKSMAKSCLLRDPKPLSLGPPAQWPSWPPPATSTVACAERAQLLVPQLLKLPTYKMFLYFHECLCCVWETLNVIFQVKTFRSVWANCFPTDFVQMNSQLYILFYLSENIMG